jgi:tungstate transport system ATP-binding protein
MSAPIYQLRGVRKEYDQKMVLQVDRLEIYPGEIFGLVGPSGAGKSTLLRLLNFLEKPSEGNISYKSEEFNSEKEMPLHLKRQVTTVFQQSLLLNRSVKANVSYGLQLRGQNNTEERTRAALRQVGLEDLADQQARTLSGGEAQRVALARAIVLQPEVLLLDEPTANLDPYNVGLIEEIVRNLHANYMTTIVLVTHNVFQAKRLAQRVSLLLEGQVIESANVNEFFEAPKDPRTAAFVRGEMVY